MSDDVVTARRNNLTFLINIHGSQTKLALVLAHTTLTQQILSSIERKKRRLNADEARYIERTLVIPAGWI